MADNNKILICWNNTAYIKNIKIDGYEVEPFTSKDSLNTIEQKAKYIVVLCELLWSHDEGETYSYSDLNGIKLGQWLRREKNIKTPILFVSFLSRKIILDIQPDAEIISTPALKHGFCQLPAKTEKWMAKLNNLSEMSGLDLIYTKRRFCSIVGLLERINHDIRSCTTLKALNEKWETLQYVDKISGDICKKNINDLKEKSIKNIPENKNDKNETEYESIYKEFEDICSIIKSTINQNSKIKKSERKKEYSILYLEDEANKNEEIQKLIELMKEQFTTVALISQPEYKVTIIKNKNFGNEFDAVVCDIEIWEGEGKNRKLTCLGCDYIQFLSKIYRHSVYIILSNITRSLHNNIVSKFRDDGVMVSTYSKRDVLFSDSTRQVFIDSIKNLIEQKKHKNKPKEKGKANEKSNYLDNFKALRDHIYNSFKYKITIKTTKSETTYSSPNDVENCITQEFNKLKTIFDKRYIVSETITNNFLSDKIKNFDELGRKKFYDNKDDITINGNDYIGKFIRVLIARRLLIYVMMQYNITDLHPIFTTSNNKLFLQNSLLFSTTIKKGNIWNDNANKIQDNCVDFLTEYEIDYIKQFTKKK